MDCKESANMCCPCSYGWAVCLKCLCSTATSRACYVVAVYQVTEIGFLSVDECTTKSDALRHRDSVYTTVLLVRNGMA